MENKQTKSTKDLIIQTAQKLFLTHGYFGTSMDSIAKELQITKAALYYHFDSKLKILTTLMQPATTNIEQFLVKQLDQDFHSYIKLLLEYRTKYPILALIMTMGVSQDDLRPASNFIKKTREKLLLVIANNFKKQHQQMQDLAPLVARVLVGVVFNPLVPATTPAQQLTKGLNRIIEFNKQR